MWLQADADEPGYCDNGMDPHTKVWSDPLHVEIVFSCMV